MHSKCSRKWNALAERKNEWIKQKTIYRKIIKTKAKDRPNEAKEMRPRDMRGSSWQKWAKWSQRRRREGKSSGETTLSHDLVTLHWNAPDMRILLFRGNRELALGAVGELLVACGMQQHMVAHNQEIFKIHFQERQQRRRQQRGSSRRRQTKVHKQCNRYTDTGTHTHTYTHTFH